MRSYRRVVVLLAVWAASGCSTQTGGYVGTVYYLYGPENALRVARVDETRPGERGLIELERAMALFELGRYEASLAALDAAEAAIAAGGAPGERNWRPDDHERVLMATLALVNALALQHGPRAAERAERVVDRIGEVPCTACGWGFSRTAAALAFEQVGRYDDAAAALDGLELEGPGEAVVARIRERCARGIADHQPAGLAPPPAATGRTVTMLLLLGIGPYRVAERVALNPTTTMKWHRSEPYRPQAVVSAAVRLPDSEEPVVAVELTDVARLATDSIAARLDEIDASSAAGDGLPERDLRHWLSLPASLQLVEVTLPPGATMLELVYLSPEGVDIDRESIRIPETWFGGPLFAARRMP